MNLSPKLYNILHQRKSGLYVDNMFEQLLYTYTFWDKIDKIEFFVGNLVHYAMITSL